MVTKKSQASSQLASATGLRVSPSAYRAILEEKGWTIAAFARRLGITRVWLTRCIDDVDRAQAYTEALWALPAQKNLRRELAARSATLERVEGAAGMKALSAARPAPIEPGYRYTAYLPVGAIVQATANVGSMAEEGGRGIVFHRMAIERGEAYGIIFEGGDFDWFRPDDIDAYLATIGIEREDLAGYSYQGREALEADYLAGRFLFW